MRARSFLALARGPAFVVAVAACVPSVEDPSPHGAAGFSFIPSDATRGAAFVTRDGYTLTIERLVVRLFVDGGSSNGTLMSLSTSATAYATEVPEGGTEISLITNARAPVADPEPEVRHGVTDEEDARFSVPPDLVGTGPRSNSEYCNGPEGRPTVLLAMRAERAREKYRIDLSLCVLGAGPAGVPIDVRRDELTTVPLFVRAERLFSTTGRTEDEPYPWFGSFAVADRNDDGLLTPEELAAARPSREERIYEAGSNDSLADLLLGRVRFMFSRMAL